LLFWGGVAGIIIGGFVGIYQWGGVTIVMDFLALFIPDLVPDCLCALFFFITAGK
jgi:hypothetical protein